VAGGALDSPILDALDADDRQDLLTLARRRRFAKGEVLFHEGDPGDSLHILVRGHVAARITTPLGDKAMVRLLRPGEFFGELATIADTPRVATIVALDAVETMVLERARLGELRGRRPAVDAAIIHALAMEVRRLAAALTEALYVPADKRVVRRVVDAAAVFGAPGEPTVMVPLTQEELAQLAGVTRSTANRVLRRAEAKGLIKIARGRVEILDHGGLVRLGA
jgi:CRP-like cAMP-binding protein